MGTNCTPLVADLFLFCNEKDFMMSLSGDKILLTLLTLHTDIWMIFYTQIIFILTIW